MNSDTIVVGVKKERAIGSRTVLFRWVRVWVRIRIIVIVAVSEKLAISLIVILTCIQQCLTN